MGIPFLRAHKITKRFGAVTALRNVDFEAHCGEVVAIVGDNGAGKSTLIKILSGAWSPTEGDLEVKGASVQFDNPADAGAIGIATIYQELALAENLTVYENVFLGREICRSFLGFPFLRRELMRQRVAQLLTDLDAHISTPDMLVAELSGGQRQAVAISRALNFNAELVIMDEPTAALAIAETRKVLNLVKQLRKSGKAIILISHNIGEVCEVADRIVVFRRGFKVAERRRDQTDPEKVISLITGAHQEVRAFMDAYGTPT